MNKPISGYSTTAKTFHWLNAILVIFMLGLGLYMTDLDFSPDKMELYLLHKSIGVAILAVVSLRLIWTITHQSPKPLATHARWERNLAKIAHIFLYVIVFFMPVTGWLMSSAYGFPVSFFDIFTLPDLIGKNESLGENLAVIHEYLGFALIGLISIHALGALKHHFWDKDITLKRMLPFSKLVILIAITSFVNSAAHAKSPQSNWNVNYEESEIVFNGVQMGKDFSGSFGKWESDIYFDENNLENSAINVEIDMNSVTTSLPKLSEYIGHELWLDTDTYEKSSFISNDITRNENGSYVAKGIFNLRGIEKPQSLVFNVTYPEESLAQAEGSMTIDRLDYGIGGGDWSEDRTVSREITIKVRLLANKALPNN